VKEGPPLLLLAESSLSDRRLLDNIRTLPDFLSGFDPAFEAGSFLILPAMYGLVVIETS
jgi:hypothetical protein